MMSQRCKPNLNSQASPALVLNVNVAVNVPDLFDASRCAPIVTVNSLPNSAENGQNNYGQPPSPSIADCASFYGIHKHVPGADTLYELSQIPSLSQISLCSRENSPTKHVRTAVSPSASQVKFAQTLKQQEKENPYKDRFHSASQYCVNRDDFSTDSLKELFALPNSFLENDNGVSTANTYRSTDQGPVARRFSVDSLRELGQLPSASNVNSKASFQCITPRQHAETPGDEPPSVESMLTPRMYTLEPMPTGMVSSDFSSANLGKLVPLIVKPVACLDSPGKDQGRIASEHKHPYFVVFYDPTMRDPTGPSKTKTSNDQNPFSDYN